MKFQTAIIALVAGLAVSVSAQTKALYQAEVLSQSPSNYFRLDSSLESTVNAGTSLQPFAGGYAADVYGNATNAWYFDDDNQAFLRNLNSPSQIINGGGTSNTISTAKGSVSFLFRTLPAPSTSGQKSLFDATTTSVGTSNHNAFTVFFENNTASEDPNALKLRFGDSSTTILPASEIAYSSWYYLAVTYDESATSTNKAKWYIGRAGGVLTMGVTTNSEDSVAGDGTGLIIGNRANYTGGFRDPGLGRIDEFAIWARQLTGTEITNQFTKLPPLPSGVMVTNVIVNDSFADGNRTNTGPLQADWWSSSSTSGNSVAAYTNKLRMVSGSSGRGLHGTFTPVTLGIGDTIRATYTFKTPATVGTGNGNTAFRTALMDFNDAGLAADLTSSSTFTNPLYINLPGYMADYDVYTVVSNSNVGIRKHQTANTTPTNTSGRYLGTTGEWNDFGSSSSNGYTFAADTEYVGVYSITRTEADGVDIFSSLSQGGVLMGSYTGSDSSDIANHYGMLGFWANTLAFGNTTTQGEDVDNGITFSNIKVEVVTYSTASPTLAIARAGSNVVLSWLTAGSTGYNLKSAPSLTSPVTWSSNGPPPVVVGDSYVVTNTVSGSQKYYRLANP